MELDLDAPDWAWPAHLQMTPERLFRAHAEAWFSSEVAIWLLMDATQVSARLHQRQRRRDAEQTPYINHPVEVARLLADCGVSDPTVIAAALLHDTIEDTPATKEQLERRYGPAIASIVWEVTDDKSLPKERRKQLQVQHAPQLSIPAKLVKLADKTVNLGDVLRAPPAGWSPHRREEYFDWARDVADGLRGVNALLEQRFDATYARRGEISASTRVRQRPC